jgi:hypothetical protein
MEKKAPINLTEEKLDKVSGGDIKNYDAPVHNPTELQCPSCGRMCKVTDRQQTSWTTFYYFQCYNCNSQYQAMEGKTDVWLDRALDM